MERVEEITLVSESFEKDEIGQDVPIATERKLLASIGSVSAREFFDAGQNGMKAQCVVYLSDYLDYQDEEVAILNGVRYTIYRTFVRQDCGIELYLRKDTGS